MSISIIIIIIIMSSLVSMVQMTERWGNVLKQGFFQNEKFRSANLPITTIPNATQSEPTPNPNKMHKVSIRHNPFHISFATKAFVGTKHQYLQLLLKLGPSHL